MCGGKTGPQCAKFVTLDSKLCFVLYFCPKDMHFQYSILATRPLPKLLWDFLFTLVQCSIASTVHDRAAAMTMTAAAAAAALASNQQALHDDRFCVLSVIRKH